MPKPEPVATMLHDAPCLLCRSSVRWVSQRDRRGVLRFVPLDSAEGRELLFDAGLEPSHADSVVLLHDGRVHRHSSALVVTLQLLGGPWTVAGALLWLVPRPLRDLGYRAVARHRHLWPFGEVCELPGPGTRASEAAGEVPMKARSTRSETDAERPGTSTAASRSSTPASESITTTGRDKSD